MWFRTASKKATKPVQSLFDQLVWKLGKMIDYKISVGGSAIEGDPMSSALGDLASWQIPTGLHNAMYTQGIADTIAAEQPRMMCMAPDKSRWNSIGLFNAPVVLPSNIAFWFHPQDTKRSATDFHIL